MIPSALGIIGFLLVIPYEVPHSGQRIFPVGMMGKALAHIRHIE